MFLAQNVRPSVLFLTFSFENTTQKQKRKDCASCESPPSLLIDGWSCLVWTHMLTHNNCCRNVEHTRESFFFLSSLLEVVILLSSFSQDVGTRCVGFICLPLFCVHTPCCCCRLDHVRCIAVLDLLSREQAGSSSTGNIV